VKSRFQSALEAKLNDELNAKALSLIGGTAKDFAAYQYWVGYAAALVQCLSYCEDIEREME
jgi:hypothetical protein